MDDRSRDPRSAGPDPGRGPGGSGARPGPWRFGRLALAFLLVTVVSGAVLNAFWDPAAPRASTEAIRDGIPWGWWFRAVHWFAAQALLLLVVAHVVETLLAGAQERMSPGGWLRATMLLPVGVAAMLGGFVMRGDAGGVAALDVWRQIVASIPWVGNGLERLLLGGPGDSLGTVALHHVGTLTLAFWAVTCEHLRRPWPDVRATAVAALAVFALAGTIPVGLGPAAGAGQGWVLAPWYLLGLQGMLLDLPVEAGWAAPLAFVLLLAALRFVRGTGRVAIVAALVLGMVAYAAWTVRLLVRAAG